MWDEYCSPKKLKWYKEELHCQIWRKASISSKRICMIIGMKYRFNIETRRMMITNETKWLVKRLRELTKEIEA